MEGVLGQAVIVVCLCKLHQSCLSMTAGTGSDVNWYHLYFNQLQQIIERTLYPLLIDNMMQSDQDPRPGQGGGPLEEAAASAGITPTLDQLRSTSEPWLEITEQPKARGLRFQYKYQGRSTGTILGERSTNISTMYPTIQVKSFNII